MAVPTQLSDLSATAASNSPAGGDAVGTTMDDYIRALASIIARIAAGTDKIAPAGVTGTAAILGANTFTGLQTANLGLTVAGADFASRGITDSATAKALTLSGSGANSITIANSATNPTIGTTGGGLSLSSNTGVVSVNGVFDSTGYIWAQSNDAVPVGGAANTGIFMGAGVIGIYFGSGAPTVSASYGSLYLRTDGGASTRLYSNNNGSTGWAAITSA